MVENIRVRAIIPLGNGIVFMHRKRMVDNVLNEYYPLPGGGVENGESLEVGLYREVLEELGLKIKIIKSLYKIIDDLSIQHIYLCEWVDGKLGTGTGPEYNDVAYSQKGEYLPEIVALTNLEKTNIVPIELKKQLLQDLSKTNLSDIEYKEIKILKTIVM